MIHTYILFLVFSIRFDEIFTEMYTFQGPLSLKKGFQKNVCADNLVLLAESVGSIGRLVFALIGLWGPTDYV